MPVLIDTETLRHRFHLARGGRSLSEVARLIGVHRITLEAFLADKRVYLRTLEAIHTWIETEEAQHGYTVVRVSC